MGPISSIGEQVGLKHLAIQEIPKGMRKGEYDERQTL